MDITIRVAELGDAAAIAQLLQQLSYAQSTAFIQLKLKQFAQDPNSVTFVAVDHQYLCGVLSLNLIPQLALAGHFARISYLCVDSSYRAKGIGKLFVQAAEQYAQVRGCDRIELHCNQDRQAAHQFYLSQGYTDAPKYFRKLLNA